MQDLEIFRQIKKFRVNLISLRKALSTLTKSANEFGSIQISQTTE